jgi:hypothetical protein
MAAPHAAYARCPSCGSPADEGTAVCTTCGTDIGDTAALSAPGSDVETPPLTAGFSCRSCGATVACEPGPRSYACAFCGSTYVAEVRGEGLSALVPEFIVPFRVGREQARGIFGDWCREGFFTPRDVRQAGKLDRLQGIYLPFWTFSMRADSTWEADIGEWWYKEKTETYTDSQGKEQTRTVRVRHTEWHPLRGRHHSYHARFQTSGARGLPQEEALAAGPFQLLEMRRYRPHYLAGWLAEPVSVPREQALAECQSTFLEAEGARIRAFLPGDTHSGLEWSTTFSEIADDLVLLPFWIGTYSYRGEVYRYVLNGQTGTATGTRPVSPVKVGLLVAGILLAILLIVLLSPELR